jgi:hypothetical protein
MGGVLAERFYIDLKVLMERGNPESNKALERRS